MLKSALAFEPKPKEQDGCVRSFEFNTEGSDSGSSDDTCANLMVEDPMMCAVTDGRADAHAAQDPKTTIAVEQGPMQ